jgi:hypothetical protein
MHRHRYHGVLAPNARARSAVVAIGRPRAEPPPPVDPAPAQPLTAPPDPEPARPSSPARIRWAVLLARIYEVLPRRWIRASRHPFGPGWSPGRRRPSPTTSCATR